MSEIKTGKLLWTASLRAPTTSSSAAVANGVVYAGAGIRLYAFDGRTGTRLWTGTARGELTDSSPVVADGALYVGDSNGILYRYDLE